MRLSKITIGNYKNISETVIDVNGITALVSVNNYGKSNMLEAINFGFDFISASPKQRKNMMCWKQGIPLSNAIAGKDFVFGLEFENTDSDIYRYVRYSFSFAWINDHNTGIRISDEKLECRTGDNGRYTSFLNRDKKAFRTSFMQKNLRKIPLADDVLALDVIPLIENVEIAEVVMAIKSLGYRRCDKLELANSFMPRPIEVAYPDEPSVIFDETDIPKTLFSLKEKYPEKYQLFEDIIFDLYPDFEEIKIIPIDVSQLYDAKIKVGNVFVSGKDEDESVEEDIPFKVRDVIYQLMIKSQYLNQPISIERMSAGTKRIFWLVANAIITSTSHTVLMGVDEVETSIHPKLMKNLMEAINESLEEGSLILTSHSPYLIQYLKPESIYIGEPTNDGTAIFKRIKHNKIKEINNISRKLDLSFGEYLFMLLSGGEDDSKILRSFLED